MKKILGMIGVMLAGVMCAFAQYYPTVATKGGVADGEIAVFDGVSGRYIRSSGETNATLLIKTMTNFVAVASSSNYLVYNPTTRTLTGCVSNEGLSASDAGYLNGVTGFTYQTSGNIGTVVKTDPRNALITFPDPASATGAVTMVNGKDGVVVLITTDIDEGTNLYYTAARVAAHPDVKFSMTNYVHVPSSSNWYAYDPVTRTASGCATNENTGPAGSNGADGAQGPAGTNGAVGPQGPAGSNGVDGATGPQGPAGTNGAVGPQGPQGPAGSNGVDGAQGPAGTNGAVGPQGPAGSNGVDGATGPQGPAGTNGVDGINGTNGATGPQGPQGPAGTNGADGAQGPAGTNGAVGPQGPAGSNGVDGATGPQGPAGTNGAVGPQGPQGPAGSNGVDGAQGPAGTNGAVGPQGPAGSNGVDGATGPQGPAGTNGAVGPQGPQGPAGSNGVSDLSSTQIVTRIVTFSGVDFDSMVGTNSPDTLYQFSWTIATNPAFTGTTVSFQSTNNPSDWYYWNGAQFEDMETGDLPHTYLNSYQARVFYTWTNSIRGATYYCRGYIINSDQWYVENTVNKILEPK